MNNVPVRFALLSAGIFLFGVMTGAVQGDTVVQVNLNGQVNGIYGPINNYQVQLFDSQTPVTVNNYLQYVNNDDYNNTIIHRDMQDHIMQGGGYELQVNNNNVITGLNLIGNYGTIQTESSYDRPNVRGTIAMALGSNPDGTANVNSATSQWFVNLTDNSTTDPYYLDYQGFTVFGHVAGEGMTIVDAINNIPTYNINNLYDPNWPLYKDIDPTIGPFANVPLFANASQFVTILSVEIIPTVTWKGGTASAPSDWGLTTNWNSVSSVPNGVGVNLSMGSGIVVNTVLDLGSANRTVGNIYYTIPKSTTIQSTEGKSLTLDNNGSASLVNVLGNHTISAPMVLKNNVLFSVNGALNVSGAISDDGGLRDLALNDVGTLTLSGTNTYSGNTHITSGRLIAVKAASLPGYNTAGKVTVNPGATLVVQAGAATGEWDATEIDSLQSHATFDEGSFLGFQTTGGNFSYGGAIAGNKGVIKLGGYTLTLTGANTFAGPLNFNGGLINAGSLNNLGNGATWNFNGGGLQFDAVFDPSPVRTMTFQSGGATFDTQANNITLSNSIGNGGSGGLTKAGSGILTLTGSNTFTGPVNFNDGMIKAASLSNLGNGSELNFISGGLQFDGVYDPSVRTMSFQLGDVVLDTQTNNITLAHAIGDGGDGGLTKVGSGTLTLTGVNTFNGPVNFSGGMIKAASLNNLGAGSEMNFDGGGLRFGGVYDPSSRTMIFLSGGAILDTQANNITLANPVGDGGPGGLTKIGSGTLTLTGTNSFTGPVNFNEGTIKAAHLNNLGAGLALNFDGGRLLFNGVYDPSVRTMTFQSGGATLDTQANVITLANSIGNGGPGGLTKAGSGTLILAGANTFTGPLNLDAGFIKAASLTNLGAGLALNFDGGGLQFNGVYDPSERTMTFQSGGATLDTQANNIILANSIGNGGTGRMTKTGSGTLTLNGYNLYTGGTVISQGTLLTTNATTLPGYESSGEVTVSSGATLAVRTGAPDEWAASEIDSLLDNAIFNSGSLLGFDTTGGNFTYTSAVTGDLGVTKLGSNTLTFTGANSYSGNTLVTSGTLAAGKTSLPGYNTSGKVAVNGDATLAIRTGTSADEWASSDIDTLLNNAAFNAGSLLGIDTTSGNFSYGSVIAGSLGITKLGSNTLTLTGTNTFTGSVNVSGGTLKLGAGSTLPTTAAVNTNASGAILDLDGNLQTIASLTGAAGSEVKLGSGTLTAGDNTSTIFAGAITSTTGGSLTKTGLGVLECTGPMTYNGATTINAGVLMINNNLSSTLDVISGAGDLSVNGATTELTASSINVKTLTIGAGSKVVLSEPTHIIPIPEPSALALLGIAALAIFFTAWKRK